MKIYLALFGLLLAAILHSQTPRLVIPTGHTETVNAVAFSPDEGRFILTGSADGTAKLWDQSGKEILTYRGHSQNVTDVAFSKRGDFVLTGSEDGTAILWDLLGKKIQTYTGHTGAVNAVAFSPDSGGKYILTGSADSTAILWDRQSGARLKTYAGHYSAVSDVAFSPSGGGKQILTASHRSRKRAEFEWTQEMGGHAKLFDRETERLIWTFSGEKEAVECVTFSPDGRFILAACGNIIRFLDLNGVQTQTLEGAVSRIKSLAISPEGEYLMTGGSSGMAELWDLVSRQSLRSMEAHPDWVNSVAFFVPILPYGSGEPIILTGGDDGARLWQFDGTETQHYARHASAITALAYSPYDQGGSVLMGCGDGTVKRWNFAKTQVQNLTGNEDIGHEDMVVDVAFSAADGGASVFSGSADNVVLQWDASGQPVQEFLGGSEPISALAISPPGPDDPAGGKYILNGTYENTIILLDRQTGEQVRTIVKTKEVLRQKSDPARPVRMFEAVEVVNDPKFVTALAFSPNDGGKFILSGDYSDTVELWNRDTGEKINTFTGHTGPINAVAFSPDGQFALSGSADGTAKLWAVRGGLIRTFARHTDAVQLVAFSPNGQCIFTSGADNTVKYWDLNSGKLLSSFAGHAAVTMACSPDGKFLLTGSLDNTAKLWAVGSGKELATLVNIDSTDWVVTTPTGLFDASPGAMALMHYVIGLEVLELEQLKERYYEPGLLAKLLGHTSGGLRPVEGLDNIDLFPKIYAATITNGRLSVTLQARKGGIGKVVLLLNDNIELDTNANPAGKTNFQIDLDRFANFFYPDSTNKLSLRAYDSGNWLKGPHYRVDYCPNSARGRGSNTDDHQPSTLGSQRDVDLEQIKLYALVVGTSSYSGQNLNLKYPDKDATAFANALRLSGAPLFQENLDIELLTTSAEPWPRKTEIKRSLREIAAKADPNDILLVYLSGHGITYPPNSEKGQFYYLTTDVASDDLSDPLVRSNKAIAQDSLQAWINQVPARKRILILDACNSGTVVKALAPGEKSLNSDQRRALERMKDRSGMFVLAGSAADKSSFEASRYGHGLLTFSLLNNMPQVAAANKTYIDVSKLFNRALEEVPRLAKDIDRTQQPELIGSGSFDIGMLERQTPFPIPQAIPVFIRANFVNKKVKDRQGVSNAINKYLETLAAEKQPALAFWDIPEFGGEHFQITGQYSLSGNTIKGEAWLYSKDQELKSFPFSGSLEKPEKMAENLMDRVFDFLNEQH